MVHLGSCGGIFQDEVVWLPMQCPLHGIMKTALSFALMGVDNELGAYW